MPCLVVVVALLSVSASLACCPPFWRCLARNCVAARVAVLDYLVFAFRWEASFLSLLQYRTATARQDLIGQGPFL